jgi:archaellum component FlaC
LTQTNNNTGVIMGKTAKAREAGERGGKILGAQEERARLQPVIDGLNQQVTTLTNQRTDLQTQLNQIVSERDRANANIGTLTDRAATLQNQLTAAQSNIQSKEANAAILQQQLNNLESQHSQAQTRVSELENQDIILRQELNQAQASIKTEQEAATKLQEELVQVNAQLAGIKNDLRARDEIIARIEAQLKAATQTISEHEAQIATLRAQLEKALQDFKQSEVQTARLQGHIDVLDQQYCQYRANESLTAQNLEDLIEEITALNADLAILKNSATASATEIAKLESQIAALEEIRKEKFVDKSIATYVASMSRRGTYGGAPEIQAIANIHGRSIEVWSIAGGGYVRNTQPFMPETPSAAYTMPIRILLLAGGSDVSAHYVAISPSFDPTSRDMQQSDIIDIPGDGNCLFAACFKAHAIAINSDVDDASLVESAYRLRLEVCSELENNDAILPNFFGNLLNRARTHTSGIGITNLFDEIPNQHKLKNKIKNLFSDYYKDLLPRDYMRSDSYSSASSSRTLQDLDDFTVLGAVDDALEFEDNDRKVATFLEEVADKYLIELGQAAYIFVGGPIELEVLAEVYDYRIEVKAYKDDKYQGNVPPVYERTFGANLPVTTTHISLALINAGTASARFIPTAINRNPLNIQPPTDLAILSAIEQGQYDNKSVFKACEDALNSITATTGKSFDKKNMSDAVLAHLENKVLLAKKKSFNCFSKQKRDDGITHYFQDFILSDARDESIREYDLITATELKKTANELRVVRKTVLKIADEIIKRCTDEIQKEMSTWRYPIESLSDEPSHLKRLCKLTGLKLSHIRKPVNEAVHDAPRLLVAVWIINILTAYGEYANETLAAMKVSDTETVASITRVANFMTNCAYVARSFFEETKRVKELREVQRVCVENLPLEKLSEITFFPDQTGIGTIKEPAGRLNRSDLAEKWVKAERVEFKINGSGETFSITKADIALSKWLKENLTQSLLVGVAILQVILTALSIRTLYDELKMCEPSNANATLVHELSDIVGIHEIVHTSDIQSVTPSISPTNRTTSEADCEYNLAMPDTTKANIFFTIFNIVLSGLSELAGPTRTFDYELSMALLAVQKSYEGNAGQMPIAISEIMTTLNVERSLSERLTNLPQPASIEKGVFKAIQDLKTRLEALKAHINTLPSNHPTRAEYEQIVMDTEGILNSLSVYKRPSIYKDQVAFDGLSGAIKSTNSNIERFKNAEAASVRSGQRNPLIFSPMSYTLNTLRGILKFSKKTKEKSGQQPATSNSFLPVPKKTVI